MADNYFGLSDTGRVRTNNEDAFLAEKVLQGRYIAACVIDGVGGYEGGEVAAALARQSILDYFSVSSGDIITMMKEAFAVANEKITAAKNENPQYESMACVATLALVDLTAKIFYYAHIGDTRLYLLRDQSLIKISKDHSFVGYLEDSGRITEAEAMQHPKRNEINKALGFDALLNVAEDIETGSSPFLPGDLLLLCSDGLTDLVTNGEMLSLLQRDSTLQAKAKALVQGANEKGGKDNITVVLVRNHRKPVVQKATKPAATIAGRPEPIKENTPNTQTSEPVITTRVKQKKGNGLTIFLAVLCLALASTVVYLLVPNKIFPKPVTSNMVVAKNEAEAQFQQALDTASGFLFSPLDSQVTLPIVLTDTIHIRRDSMHIQGKGMRFLKSPGFTGPAFALSDSCNYVLLENMSFENFDVGILVQNKALHLKNVRFVGCRVAVQGQIFVPDNVPVTGAVTNLLQTDSLSR